MTNPPDSLDELVERYVSLPLAGATFSRVFEVKAFAAYLRKTCTTSTAADGTVIVTIKPGGTR